MDTETMIFRYGFTEEEAEALQKAARIWAERVKHHIEEVIEAVLHIVSAGSSEFEKLDDIRKELEEIGREPRARRRKMERSRARAIEQRYWAEIHRFERERFCRRIFKPP